MTIQIGTPERIAGVLQQTGSSRESAARPMSSNYFRRHRLVTTIIFVIVLVVFFVLSGAHFGSIPMDPDRGRVVPSTTGQFGPPGDRLSPTAGASVGFDVIPAPATSRPLFR